MDYFTGLDVSLRSCALCIDDAKGTVLLEGELPCEVSDIAVCLASFPQASHLHPYREVPQIPAVATGPDCDHDLCRNGVFEGSVRLLVRFGAMLGAPERGGAWMNRSPLASRPLGVAT